MILPMSQYVSVFVDKAMEQQSRNNWLHIKEVRASSKEGQKDRRKVRKQSKKGWKMKEKKK